MKAVETQVAMAELLPMIEDSFRQGMTVVTVWYRCFATSVTA